MKHSTRCPKCSRVVASLSCVNEECDYEAPDVDHRARDYMARAGVHRGPMDWSEELQAHRYPVQSYGIDWRQDESQEALDECAKMLPVYVPGLKVVETELTEKKGREDYRRAYVWFTWSREAMWARFKELFEEYGVADERLAYEECSGTYSKNQPSLPGIVYPEPVAKSQGYVFSSWTAHGLMGIERGFIKRICEPNRGGPEASASSNLRCEVGDEWWLVGTRGDSEDVMSLEIQASPLEPHVKENLLYNLRNYRAEAAE